MGYDEDQPVEMLEQDDTQSEEHAGAQPVGTRLAGFKGRITGALAHLDKGRLDQFGLDSGAHLDEVHDVVGEINGIGYEPDGPEYELEADAGQPTQYIDMPEAESTADSEPAGGSAFPVGRLGYNRAAVDARIAELEAELAELRAMPPQPSINEEIERLGEQTASILVVAHDQANQTTRAAEEKAQATTRLAQEEADRCIAHAASNAVAITEKAKRELRELDEETDTVWRERTRLLEDAQTVGSALIALAEEAKARFPAEGKGTTSAPAARSGPSASAATSVPSAPTVPPPVAGV
jgi:cell division septum initiation protein DivIVA